MSVNVPTCPGKKKALRSRVAGNFLSHPSSKRLLLTRVVPPRQQVRLFLRVDADFWLSIGKKNQQLLCECVSL